MILVLLVPAVLSVVFADQCEVDTVEGGKKVSITGMFWDQNFRMYGQDLVNGTTSDDRVIQCQKACCATDGCNVAVMYNYEHNGVCAKYYLNPGNAVLEDVCQDCTLITLKVKNETDQNENSGSSGSFSENNTTESSGSLSENYTTESTGSLSENSTSELSGSSSVSTGMSTTPSSISMSTSTSGIPSSNTTDESRSASVNTSSEATGSTPVSMGSINSMADYTNKTSESDGMGYTDTTEVTSVISSEATNTVENTTALEVSSMKYINTTELTSAGYTATSETTVTVV